MKPLHRRSYVMSLDGDRGWSGQFFIVIVNVTDDGDPRSTCTRPGPRVGRRRRRGDGVAAEKTLLGRAPEPGRILRARRVRTPAAERSCTLQLTRARKHNYAMAAAVCVQAEHASVPQCNTSIVCRQLREPTGRYTVHTHQTIICTPPPPPPYRHTRTTRDRPTPPEHRSTRSRSAVTSGQWQDLSR